MRGDPLVRGTGTVGDSEASRGTLKPLVNLLIITHESVGERMAGPGIRAWEIARALGKQGIQVTLATPFPSRRESENVRICEFSWDAPSSIARLIEDSRAIMSIGPVLARVVHLLGTPILKPTIVDVYYVPEIERILLNLSIGQLDFDPTSVFRDELFAYLRQGDFFVCASENQYDFWLGALLAVGRLNSRTLATGNVTQFIGMVPLGLPDEPPVPGPNLIKGVIPGISAEDKVIFWGGGIWDWNDPFTLIEALKIVLRRRDDVRVVFGALHHYERQVVPEMSVAGRLLQAVEREHWQDRYVFFRDWIPYDQRESFLMEADVGVSLNLQTIENRYAVRARILDCLWASLPCILSAGDHSAQLLERAGLARLVQPGDVASVAEAIWQILADKGLRQHASQRARPFVEQLGWSFVVQPILNYLSDPQMAPDAEESKNQLRYSLPLRREWESLHSENEMLHSLLGQYRKRRAVRYADRLTAWLSYLKRR